MIANQPGAARAFAAHYAKHTVILRNLKRLNCGLYNRKVTNKKTAPA